MSLTLAITIATILTAIVFLCLWTYYDRRDYALFERERRKTTFHCAKCDNLYIVRGTVDEAPCPRCNHTNGRLKF